MIVQAVREDLVIEDIRFNVPRGRPVTIPGNLACDSRDLGKLMSQNRIIKLDSNPRLDNAISGQPRNEATQYSNPDPPEILDLQAVLQRTQAELRAANFEVQRLKGELESSRIECGQLLAEGSQLRSEINKLKGEDSKLSAILDKLDSIPTRVMVQASGVQAEVKQQEIQSAEEDVPIFVPTFGPAKKLTVKEDKVDGNSAAAASKALKDLRKGKGR
jgi:chromosome segregation ATPase